MAIGIREFKRKKPIELTSKKGRLAPMVLEFLRKNSSKAFTAKEIFLKIGCKGRPSGTFYILLKELVKARQITNKGSYFALKRR